MRRSLHILLFLLVALSATAQRVRCNAPRTVETGSRFQIEYVIEGSDVSAFELGRVPDGLEIIGGPFQSEMSSYQVVNGHYSGSTTVSISYVAVATRNGNILIPPAHVIARKTAYNLGERPCACRGRICATEQQCGCATA